MTRTPSTESWKAHAERYRERLVSEMGKYGRSQTALARHLGVNQSAVSRLLSGERRLRLEEQAGIEAYLSETDPTPRSRPVPGLPPTIATAGDPLDAFPDLEKFVSSSVARTTAQAQALAEIDSDYPTVMTCAALLEGEVNRVVAQLIRDGEEDEEAFGMGLRHNFVDKIEAIARSGRLSPQQSGQLLAIFAIRDAFAHSQTPLALIDDAVLPVVQQVVNPSYFDAQDAAYLRPQALRFRFLLTAISLAHLLARNDPDATARMLLDAAAKSWDASRDEN